MAGFVLDASVAFSWGFPGPVPFCPPLKSPRIVLLYSNQRIFTDSDIKAASCSTPKNVNVIRLMGNS